MTLFLGMDDNQRTKTATDTSTQPSLIRPSQRESRSTPRYVVWPPILVLLLILQLVYVPQLCGTAWSILLSGRSQSSHSDRAHAILKRYPLIDGHNDLLIRLRAQYQNEIYNNDFRQRFENGSLDGQFDLVRTKQGGYGGAFWSAFYLCPQHIDDFSDAAYDPST